SLRARADKAREALGSKTSPLHCIGNFTSMYALDTAGRFEHIPLPLKWMATPNTSPLNTSGENTRATVIVERGGTRRSIAATVEALSFGEATMARAAIG